MRDLLLPGPAGLRDNSAPPKRDLRNGLHACLYELPSLVYRPIGGTGRLGHPDRVSVMGPPHLDPIPRTPTATGVGAGPASLPRWAGRGLRGRPRRRRAARHLCPFPADRRPRAVPEPL